ncbi:Y-family DNA polymerase [Neptunicella sp. SCSIO 80796]|uniref:Y-family DNA polymerase n=1 Tax=Neptunicella plasticusilytica TaxID=3117012 RepID=UPI003A4E0F6F
MTLWVYLHFPSLQLDSLFAQQEEQASIIVYASNNEVVQLNSAASAQGIKIGMGLGMASGLCRELNVHVYNPEMEKARLKEIAHWLYLVTSDITFFEPNGILLRISNMLTLYGGLASYWQKLENHLGQLDLTVCYATGYSPLAARLLARAKLNIISANRELMLSAVKQQPLAATELSSKQIEKLSRVGITTLDDLLKLSMPEVANRFDIELVNYIGRLLGQFRHPQPFYHPAEVFERYLELLFDMDNVQWLVKPLGRLLEQLQVFLTVRDKLAHELILTLYQRDADSLEVMTTSATGEYRKDKWLELFALRLESVALASPVTGISLKASRVVERYEIRVDLFDGKRGHQSAHELISLLQAKLGQNAVKGIKLTDDPRPQLTSQFGEPLNSAAVPPVNRHIVRPTVMLPSPNPLRDKVTITQGPERLFTGWWDGKSVHRDYFIARCRDGRWLWIFRNHKQQWFVHGWFC